MLSVHAVIADKLLSIIKIIKIMITENIIVEKKSGKEFSPLPENIYQCELLDVNLNKRPTYDTRLLPDNMKVYEPIFSFQFTLLKGKDGDEDLRLRNVWDNFVPVYLYISKKTGKNKLYQIVEALLGHQLSPEEEAMLDKDFINSMVGKQCRIGTKHKKSGDKIFDNIETYYPIEVELPVLTEEEKEKARVKVKGGDEKVNYAEGEVADNGIPF